MKVIESIYKKNELIKQEQSKIVKLGATNWWNFSKMINSSF